MRQEARMLFTVHYTVHSTSYSSQYVIQLSKFFDAHHNIIQHTT